jgi:hypothetical protein
MLTLINKFFFQDNVAFDNVLLFTTTSKLLQKAYIVNLCVLSRLKPRLILFSFHNFEGVENTYYLHKQNQV